MRGVTRKVRVNKTEVEQHGLQHEELATGDRMHQRAFDLPRRARKIAETPLRDGGIAQGVAAERDRIEPQAWRADRLLQTARELRPLGRWCIERAIQPITLARMITERARRQCMELVG